MAAEEREVAAAVDVRDFTQENFGDEDAEVSHLFAQTQQAEAEIVEATGCLLRPEGETAFRSPPIEDTPGEKATQFCKNIVTKAKECHDNACEALKKNPTLKNWDGVSGVFLAADAVPELIDYTKSTGRKFLRLVGFSAGTAQEMMNIAEVTTCCFPLLRAGVVQVEGAVLRGTAKLSRTTERLGNATYDFMQRAAAMNRPQHVLVYVNSGAPRVFNVGYKPIQKPMLTLNSMKAQGTGGIVSRGSAPSASASVGHTTRSPALPQVAGRAEAAGVRPHNEWKIESYDKVVEHSKFGKLYRDPKTNLWWSKDTAGHGGSQWKVFEEKGKGLQWFKDADQYGTYLTGKHKGPIGTFIPWKDLGGRQ